MYETVHMRVLRALSDSQARQIVAVCLTCDCTTDQLQVMAERGLVRFDAFREGKIICITPRGLDHLGDYR
jgi:hypothetical protein